MHWQHQYVKINKCPPGLPQCGRLLLLIEGAGTQRGGEVVAGAAALLVLVQYELLQPLLAVPAVEVSLHRHLHLLLPQPGGRAQHGTVPVTAHSSDTAGLEKGINFI